MALSAGELAELGVKRISTGGLLTRAAIGGLMRAATELRDDGTFGFAAEAPSFRELNRWLE
jgi:2-methylisocitrate lyase-like PEP mutase family enzyme